jgi:hypothetical protein
MHKTHFICFLFSLVLWSSLFAQTKSNTLNFIETEKLKSFIIHQQQKKFVILQTLSPLIYSYTVPNTFNINNHTPKGAVFCRMENLSREKWHVWIQIHAGDRTSYNISTNEY